jgi:hypothetical protein
MTTEKGIAHGSRAGCNLVEMPHIFPPLDTHKYKTSALAKNNSMNRSSIDAMDLSSLCSLNQLATFSMMETMAIAVAVTLRLTVLGR